MTIKRGVVVYYPTLGQLVYFLAEIRQSKGLKEGMLGTVPVQLESGADGMWPVCPTN